MDTENTIMKRQERAIFELRRLYEGLGYKKYKMSKFEEYDLYLEYKSFLPSQQIISFTDMRGKLLALKPDVTLSIAKNAAVSPNSPEKLYYNENVYRTPKGSNEYREITQVGLEFLGELDIYSQCEVILLAYRSLQGLGENSLLVVSHMGFVSGLMEYCTLPPALEESILSCISHKNAHEIQRLCILNGVEQEKQNCLIAMTRLCGGVEKTLKLAEKLVKNDSMNMAIIQLRDIWANLSKYVNTDNLNLDFSVINDLSYYNGIIFQGFLDGAPSAVLSGGRYDNLMEKLGKHTNAMGFAVYVDVLEHVGGEDATFDVDVLLLYESGADTAKLFAAAAQLAAEGQRIRVQSSKPSKLSYKRMMKLGEGGLETIEAND